MKARFPSGRVTFAAAAVLLLTLVISPCSAKADTVFSIGLNVGNTGTGGISGFPKDFGSITIDMGGTGTNQSSVTVTVHMFNTGANGYQYLIGKNDALGLNTVGGHATASGITATTSSRAIGFTTSGFSGLGSGGTGNMDGFGSYNSGLDGPSSNGDAAEDITFTLTKSSGTWTDASHVLTANSGGYLVAAHVIVIATNSLDKYSASTAATATGFGANGNGAPPLDPVPEFSSGILMCLMLGGSGGLYRIRRFFAKPAAA